jgi:hypothetical protein
LGEEKSLLLKSLESWTLLWVASGPLASEISRFTKVWAIPLDFMVVAVSWHLLPFVQMPLVGVTEWDHRTSLQMHTTPWLDYNEIRWRRIFLK